MIEINLIPDVKREYLKARTLRNAVISTSVVVGIVIAGIAVVLGLIFAGQLVTESLQDRAIKADGEALMAVEDIDKVVTLQNQLSVIGDQHSTKTIDSRLFDVISAINPPAPNQSVISTIRLNPAEKTIAIEGSAANGYIALEVFKKTIINTSVQVREGEEDVRVPLAADIVPGEASFGENAEGARVLRFSFTFTYPDELFMYSDSPVTIVTPERQIDVTDSKLGIPESLFGAKPADIEDGSEGENNGR